MSTRRKVTHEKRRKSERKCFFFLTEREERNTENERRTTEPPKLDLEKNFKIKKCANLKVKPIEKEKNATRDKNKLQETLGVNLLVFVMGKKY